LDLAKVMLIGRLGADPILRHVSEAPRLICVVVLMLG
jgi:single-stranded DNA-binding protein